MAKLSQYCTLFLGCWLIVVRCSAENPKVCNEMKSYRELIEQTFEFPQKEFKVRDHELLFNDVPFMDIIKQYGTPA
jgi:hypothetical protein